MENDIILSICIPTFNRADYLEKTIISIVNQNKFQNTNQVELVISDNCSDDNTKDVCEKYIKIYGEKICYYRNSENIGDLNFEKVLSYGKGLYLKLNNDILSHKKESLNLMIDTINNGIKQETMVLFLDGRIQNNVKVFKCDDLNVFVKNVSYWSTWIGCFGIWKVDFDRINSFSRNVKLQLVQTDVLFRLLKTNRPVVVDNTIIFSQISLKYKGGYNFYKIFVENYLELLKEIKVERKISRLTFHNEKKKLLKNFIFPNLVSFEITHRGKNHYTFDKKWSILFDNFWYYPVFYIIVTSLFILKLADFLDLIPFIKRCYLGYSNQSTDIGNSKQKSRNGKSKTF